MTMSNVLRALILVGIICTIQGLLEYRCDVLGCGTGETCVANTHSCTCAGGDFGVPCDTPGACASGTTCVAANTITETNKCKTVDTKCICIEGFYGDLCQYQRVRATCVTGDPLKIYVAPYLKTGNTIKVYFAADAATFNGDLSTYGCVQDTIAGEEFLRDDLPQSTAGAPVGDCAVATLVDGKQEYYVYLQQASPYRTTGDQVFKVICDPSTDVQLSVSTVSELDVSSPVDETSSAIAGIVMKVRKEETANMLVDIPAGSAVTIGTPLAITFEHQGPIMAATCKVSDVAGGTEYPLITDSCVPAEAEALFWDPIQVSDPSTVVAAGGTADYNMLKLRLRAFRLQGTTASMSVTCTICKDKACVGGSAPTCSPDNLMTTDMLAVYADLPAAFRRRRAVTGLETQTSMTLSLTVVDGQVVIPNGNDGLSNGSTDVGNCYKSTSVLLPIILLAVLLLVAMVMTFFFCRRLTNELERKESETNMAYKS